MENELCKKKTTAPDTSVGADDGQPLHNSTENSISAFEGEINGDFQNSTESLDEIYRRMQRLTDPHYLHTISMTELYQTAYQSRPPIIDGLLYAGAYILAGAPKIGKSFLVAQIAYHVSTGKALWDYEVHPGTVLYLALEDDFQRIQSRMTFPTERLISLAAKTTCKDRWRQVINEADRLRDRPKYLCTLQQGISPAQMDEMQSENVILVVPRQYITSYPADRQDRIWTLSKFVSYVREVEGL